MFKVNNKDFRPGVFIVDFEHISHLLPLFLLINLNKKMLTGPIMMHNFF